MPISAPTPSLDTEESSFSPPSHALPAALAAARDCLRPTPPKPQTPRIRKFDYRGARFTVQIAADGQARLRLSLQGDLGWLPYTAENPLARRQASTLLAQLRAAGGDLWSLSSSGLIGFACETVVEGEQAGRPPLEILAMLMLSLAPCLDPMIDLLHPRAPQSRDAAPLRLVDDAA